MAFLGYKASLRSFAILIALTLGFAFPLAESQTVQATPNICTPTESVSGYYRILKFLDVGTCGWRIPTGVTNVEVVVVGGGGGGASENIHGLQFSPFSTGGGGGGGGGQVSVSESVAVTDEYAVIFVGGGGSGGATPTITAGPTYPAGSNGADGDSSIFAVTSATTEAIGGKGGKSGTEYSDPTTGDVNLGGEGGDNRTYGHGSNEWEGAGGGGGAGGAGTNGLDIMNVGGCGGNGGPGTAINITNASEYYGGGGGGGGATMYTRSQGTKAAIDASNCTESTRGTGGTGGGGNSAQMIGTLAAARNGSANTGGGGGGGGYVGDAAISTSGGSGGSGIVIVKYLDPTIAAAPYASDLVAQYVGSGYQPYNKTWPDASGHGYNVTTSNVGGTPAVVTTDGAAYGSTESITVLQGTTAESLRFPTGVLPSDYTMLYVARYNGSNKQRIFTGCTYNWISGFWGTAAGVAYHGDPNWLGNSASHFDNTKWLLGADQKNSFRGNSVPLSRPAYTEGIADRLCLNTGGEKSEFQIAEIVIYNRALNLAEVQNVETYLAEKYHIDAYVASQRDDPDQYLVQDLTVAPLTEDTIDKRPGYNHKSNTLAVSWSAHNFSATDYKIEYATSPSGPWTTWDHPVSTAMYYEVTGLDSLKAYYFRVSMKVDGAYKPAVTSTTAMSVYYINKLPVTISQTQESLHNGGTGGGPYLDYCPGGSVAVGLKGVLKDDGWASRTQLMCRTVNYANTEFTSSAVGTKVRGGDNGTAMSSLCSTGAMTGVDVYGSLGTYINAYKTRCNSVFAGEPANPTTAPISGPSFGNVVASNCPLGEYVIGIRGRSGSWLDQLGVVCGTVGAYFVPSAPKLTSVIGAGGKVTLTWEAPTSNGGTPITGYEAHMYETNATTASGSCTTSSELTCTIDVGNIYTSYQFNVQAINDVGKSESSNIIQLAAKPDPKKAHLLPNGNSPELKDGEVIAWTEDGFISVSSKPASAEQLKVTTANGLTLYFQSTKDNGDEIPLTSDDVLQLVKNNKLHLTLSGFQPNSDVSIWLFSTPTQMGSAKTDAQGNAEINLDVSGSVPTGNHTVEVNGVNKDGTTTSTAMGVQVLSKVPDGNSSTSSGNTTEEDPATTDDPAAPTDTSGTTTDPTTDSQEPLLDDRGLEIIDPAVDAPVETAEVAVVAITLVSAVTAAASAVAAVGAAGAAAGAAVAGAGGAAGGAAGGTTASRSASSSSTGATSRTTPSSSEATDGDESASITTVDVKHGEFVGRAMHWGDALSLWTIPWMTRLDRPSRTHAVWTARWSPLTSNLISDGAYLRAMFGIFNALLPLIGFVLGIVGATQTHGMVLPPSAVVLGAVAVLGVFDAIAGFVGIMTFIIGTVLFDGVHNAGDARLLAGIAAIGFVPATLVTSFRHIRRKHAEGFADWWERLTDIAVGSFLAGWVTKSIVGALPALAGVKLPIADYADEIGIAVAVAMPLRIALEEIAAQYFPARLNRLHPDVIAPASNLQKSISLALRAAVFMFVASAFIGWNWQLYVGTIVFIVPAYLNVFQDKLPNYPRLYQFLPAGLPGMAWALWLASYVLTVLISVYGESPDLAKMAFVVLPLVSLVFSTLGALGRAPAPGDVRWYQRPTWSFIYRIGGVAILVYTMHLAGIV